MDGVRRKTTDPTSWLLGGILVVLLAIFGYLISLNTLATRTATRLDALESQMRDVAGYIGPLWLAHSQKAGR